MKQGLKHIVTLNQGELTNNNTKFFRMHLYFHTQAMSSMQRRFLHSLIHQREGGGSGGVEMEEVEVYTMVHKKF